MSVLRTMVAVCACVSVAACGEKEPESPAAPAAPSGQTAPAPAPGTTPSAMRPIDGDETATAQETLQSAASDLEAKAKEAEAAARAAFEGYMAQVRDMGLRLEQIENRIAAAAAAPEVRSFIEKLQESQDRLLALPDDVFNTLLKEYEARLGELSAQLERQVERISNDPDLSGSLGELLKQIPLLG